MYKWWYRALCCWYTLFFVVSYITLHTTQAAFSYIAIQSTVISPFIHRSNLCPSNQYICSLCFLHTNTHTHTLVRAQCDLCGMPSSRTVYQYRQHSPYGTECVWLHIQCFDAHSFRRWNVPNVRAIWYPLNVRMTHFASISLSAFVFGVPVPFAFVFVLVLVYINCIASKEIFVEIWSSPIG